jgi:hypothetical protein
MVDVKKKSFSDSSVCYDHLCPTSAAGNNTKNPYNEAANCIAIAAMSKLMCGTTLAPFGNTHKPSQSQTGYQEAIYQVPRNDDEGRATLVPAHGEYSMVRERQCIFFFKAK